MARPSPTTGTRAASCWPARPTRPASRSSPCPQSRRSSRRPAGRDGRTASDSRLGSHARGQLGQGAQRGHRGVRHRDRAPVARLDLAPREEPRRPGDVRPGLRRGPGRRVEPSADGDAASARGRRGGTPPRRCDGRSDRASAGAAGWRWRAVPTRSPLPRPPRRPRPVNSSPAQPALPRAATSTRAASLPKTL